MIQFLPQPAQRIDTGALRLGDDWPGIFIRGDSALGKAGILRGLIERIDYKPAKIFLAELAELFESCKMSEEGARGNASARRVPPGGR